MSTFTQLLRELTVLHLQATVVLGLVLSAFFVLRNVSPRLRHAMLSFALLGLMLLPLQYAVPLQWIAVDPAWVPVDVTLQPDTLASTSTQTSAGSLSAEGTPTQWTVAAIVSVGLLALWGLGATVFSARVIILWLGARSLVRNATAPDARCRSLLARTGGQRDVRLLLSDRIDTPIVFGVFRSTVLLPMHAVTWNDERLEAVLRHELAHVDHRDPKWLRLADLGLVLYWMHPLYWLASSRLRLEAEHAADDAVLGSGMRATNYAAALVELTRSLPHRPRAAWATGASHPSQLTRRVLHILADRPHMLPHLRQIVPVALGSLGAVLCTAVLYCDRPSELPAESTGIDPIGIPHIELRQGVSAAPAKGDIRVEIRPDSFRLRHQAKGVVVDLPLHQAAFDQEDLQGDHLVMPMYDALSDLIRDDDIAVYWVDAAIPYATIVNVAYTFGRLGLRHHRFVFVTPYGPRALEVGPPIFPSVESPQSVRVDLLGDGHKRIKGQFTVEPDVSCNLALTVRPLMSTSYAEVVATALAHVSTDSCNGGVIIEADAD